MEKRKIYILTTLIILALLTALAVWYAYIVRKESLIGQTQDIETLNINVPTNFPLKGIGNDTDDVVVLGSKYDGEVADSVITNSATTTENTILKPETWSLVKMHSEPVSNINIVDKEVKYIDIKTGKIFTADVATLTERVVTTEVVQDIRDSYVLLDNYVLIVPRKRLPYVTQYLSDGTLSSPLKVMRDEMLQVAQTNTALYYTLSNTNGGISIKRFLYSDLSEKIIPTEDVWSSPLSGWLIAPTESGIYITQKASNNIPGYSYILSNGELTPIAQDLPGLITNLSPNGSKLLYSTSGKASTSLYLKDVSTGEVTTLYTKTLASKCAWDNDSIMLYCAIPTTMPVSVLPDSWYKGITHFTDSIWSINTDTGDALELAPYTGLDIIDINIAVDTLVFKNKTNQSLWAITKD